MSHSSSALNVCPRVIRHFGYCFARGMGMGLGLGTEGSQSCFGSTSRLTGAPHPAYAFSMVYIGPFGYCNDPKLFPKH